MKEKEDDLKRELEELREKMLKNFQTWTHTEMREALERALKINKLLNEKTQ